MMNLPTPDGVFFGHIQLLIERVSRLEAEHATISTRLDQLAADVDRIKRQVDLANKE